MLHLDCAQPQGSMDITAVERAIRRVLTAPDVDLSTISSKRVRKELSESFGTGTIKQNKEVGCKSTTTGLARIYIVAKVALDSLQAIDALIIEAFNEIATASGVQPENSEQEQSGNRVAEAIQAPAVKEELSETHAEQNGHYPGTSTGNQYPPETTPGAGTSDEDDDDKGRSASSSYSDNANSSSKSKPSKPKFKASPQKRRLQDTNVPPDSSPSIPLALATSLTDEEYARQLQDEMNTQARGRATRGGGYQKSSVKNGKRAKGSTGSRGAKFSKVKSKAYISDSDLSGDEEEHRKSPQRRKRRNSSEEDGDEEIPRKKRSGAGGGGGGYNKELALSEPLQKVCGVPTVRNPFYLCKHTDTSNADRKNAKRIRCHVPKLLSSSGCIFESTLYKIQPRDQILSTTISSLRYLASKR